MTPSSRAPAPFAAALFIALSAACASPAGSGGVDPALGEIRVSYTSANSTLGGAFHASGAPGAGPSWAGARRMDDVEQTTAVGVVSRGGGAYDQATVRFPDTGVGTYRADAACEGDGCAGVLLSLGATTGGAGQWVCASVTGSVRVMGVGAGRVRGEFSGTSRCYSPAAPGQAPVLEMTGGTFDVAVLDALP